MKGLGGTSPFHRFTNPRRDNSVYFWSWGIQFTPIAYLLKKKTLRVRSPSTFSSKAIELNVPRE